MCYGAQESKLFGWLTTLYHAWVHLQVIHPVSASLMLSCQIPKALCSWKLDIGAPQYCEALLAV